MFEYKIWVFSPFSLSLRSSFPSLTPCAALLLLRQLRSSLPSPLHLTSSSLALDAGENLVRALDCPPSRLGVFIINLVRVLDRTPLPCSPARWREGKLEQKFDGEQIEEEGEQPYPQFLQISNWLKIKYEDMRLIPIY